MKQEFDRKVRELQFLIQETLSKRRMAFGPQSAEQTDKIAALALIQATGDVFFHKDLRALDVRAESLETAMREAIIGPASHEGSPVVKANNRSAILEARLMAVVEEMYGK